MAQVIFLSDAHLGSGPDSRQRERELCAFLDSIKSSCNTLFLLGDMFDFWFTYRHLVPRGHVRLLGKIAEFTDAGIPVHFFTGNHDMWLFDYLTKECGVTIHEEPEVFDIDGRRFLIGHGDGLGHTDRWFDFVRLFFRSRICQRLFALLPSTLTFPIAYRWSESNKRKHERHNTQHYLGDDREGIVIYCKERLEKEHFDYCIFGHRHIPMVKVLNEQCSMFSDATQSGGSPLNTKHLTLNTVYINTGDWLTNRNYVAYSLTDHTIELYNLKEQVI